MNTFPSSQLQSIRLDIAVAVLAIGMIFGAFSRIFV